MRWLAEPGKRSRLHFPSLPVWALGIGAAIALLIGALLVGGRWALAHLDASPQPVAMTASGLRWQIRWTPAQRARLTLANASPMDHRAAQRLLRAGQPHDAPIPWIDAREMQRVRAAVHAHGDCALEAEFLRRTGQDPPPDDHCGLSARIAEHPLVRAVREETAGTTAEPTGALACMDRHAAILRAGLADAALPFLLRDAVTCVRDAAAMCGPLGCPDVVTIDVARLVIEHRVALRATTHGAALRPVWWRRPTVLRANLRRLASVATTLGLDTLDARFASGEDWPRGFTWASVVAAMHSFPSTPRDHRPIVAHLLGVGVEESELANPWTSSELRAAGGNARLSALVEWWRLGQYTPSRDAPARERSVLVQRAVAVADTRRTGAVLAALGDPTVESVEALALVAYRLTSERDLVDPWLRGAVGFLPPGVSDRASRCRLRTALRQAAQRLRRTGWLAANPWAGQSSRACAVQEVPAREIDSARGDVAGQ